MKLATMFAFSLLAASAQAEVLVVDDSGGTPYATIQAGIDAAAPDDIVFIRGGIYDGFVLDGKPLTIVGASGQMFGESPWVRSGSLVRNVAAGTVKLEGLRLDGQPPAEGPLSQVALRVTNCQASVRIQECLITGFVSEPGTLPAGAAALRVVVSDDVVVLKSNLNGALGGQLAPQAPAGGPGLHAIDSRMTLWACQIQGGLGGGSELIPGMSSGNGGPGTLLQGSHVIFENCLSQGGAGGNSQVSVSNGGPGVSGDAASTLWVRAATLAGGGAGKKMAGAGSAFGSAGPPLSGATEVVQLPGSAHFVSAPKELLEAGEAFKLLVAIPGLLVVSTEGDTLPLLGWGAPLHSAPGGLIIAVSNGNMPVVAPVLPVGVETLTLHLQLIGSDHSLGMPLVLTAASDLP